MPVLRKQINPTPKTPNLHSRINNMLTVVVLLLGFYLVAMPFWPQVSYATGKITKKYSDTTQFEVDTQTKQEVIPKDNRLIIPQIGLDELVHESNSASVLQKGIWHRPRTSTPDKGGNTVLVAHRFTYNSPALFYHLDKLKVDDNLTVTWGGKRYDYQVRDIKTVEPTAVEIEKNTSEQILTLYTCTPLWTAKQRLVITAELIEESL